MIQHIKKYIKNFLRDDIPLFSGITTILDNRIQFKNLQFESNNIPDYTIYKYHVYNDFIILAREKRPKPL
jgi:hypothetical protein